MVTLYPFREMIMVRWIADSLTTLYQEQKLFTMNCNSQIFLKYSTVSALVWND